MVPLCYGSLPTSPLLRPFAWLIADDRVVLQVGLVRWGGLGFGAALLIRLAAALES